MKFHAGGPTIVGALLLGVVAVNATDVTITPSLWEAKLETALARRSQTLQHQNTVSPSSAGDQNKQSLTAKGSFKQQKSLSRNPSTKEASPGNHHELMTTGNKKHDEEMEKAQRQLGKMCNQTLDFSSSIVPASWLMEQRVSKERLNRRERYLRNAYWVRALKIEREFKNDPEKTAALLCWNEMSGIVAMSQNKVTMQSMIKERRRKVCHQVTHGAVVAAAVVIAPVCVTIGLIIAFGSFGELAEPAVGMFKLPYNVARAAEARAASSKGGYKTLPQHRDHDAQATSAGCQDDGAYTCLQLLGKPPHYGELPEWIHASHSDKKMRRKHSP